MTKASDVKKDNPITQRFVFGLDEGGKPIGARFPTSETKVFEVAKSRKLECHSAYNEEWAALGMQLPVGRVYARGKSFIPAIPKALYEQLQATLARCKEEHDRSQAERTAAAAAARDGGSDLAQKPANVAAAILPPLASGLPQNWESIAVGNMVLAFEGPGEGYWEAIVLARDNEILTLRYRDYPKAPKFERHISTVALINPRPA
jgi:hypothetical protein